MSTNPGLRRRQWLQGAGALAVGIVPAARADMALALAVQSFPEVITALGGMPRASALITLDLPLVAENGALVPVMVSSALPGTREILILVDGNPQPVAVRFDFPEGTEAFVATRIRLAQSATVHAVARTDDGLYATARATQVTVGGCG